MKDINEQQYTTHIQAKVKEYTDICKNILSWDNDIYTKIDYSTRRKSHLGGLWGDKPGISLAGNLFIKNYKIAHGVGKIYEYKSYENDSVIGNVFSEDPDHYVLIIVAHEMSHAYQRWSERELKLARSLPHGATFKKYYMQLRTEINKMLPNQDETRAKYAQALANIKKRELYGTT